MQKYSFLMSVYYKENAKNLFYAIKSMVNQTVSPTEIIIVKDGELTQELDDVLDFYKKKYKDLFKIIGYKENKGLGYALNYGLNYCSNELVARMDSDDISTLDRCEQQLRLLDDSIDVISGNIADFIDNIDNIVGYRKLPEEDEQIKKYLKKRCPLNHVAVMFRKSSVIKSGSYKDFYNNEDYYLWIRMYLNNCTFKNTGTTLVYVRVGEDFYNRRGGLRYFKSECSLQKIMLNKKIISFNTFLINVFKRFVIQILLPNKIRGYIFKKFAREY